MEEQPRGTPSKGRSRTDMIEPVPPAKVARQSSPPSARAASGNGFVYLDPPPSSTEEAKRRATQETNSGEQSRVASDSQEIDCKLATMAPPRGRPSTGRRRLDMTKPREDKTSRQVTFSKRRPVLFKMAHGISMQCGARLAVVVFSEAGNPFAFGSPSTDAVLQLPAVGSCDGCVREREVLEQMCEATKVATEQLAAERKRMNDIGDRVTEVQAARRCWWEADVEELGAAELVEFGRSLRRLRDNVSRRVEVLRSAAPTATMAAPPPGTPTTAITPGTLNAN